MSSRICYAVSCWSGPRRRTSAPPSGLSYLRRQVNAVEELSHDLALCLFVDNQFGSCPEYEEELALLEGREGFAVMRRPNIGLSYGARSDVFIRHRSAFDYYIVVEDDYVPVQEGFDQILVDLIEQAGPRCGFLGGCLGGGPGTSWPVHMAVSIGIMRAAAMEEILASRGCLPFVVANGYDGGEASQIMQSQAFVVAGWALNDWLAHYSTPYIDPSGNRCVYGDGKPPLFEALT